jgi:hypothetical protein
MSVDLKMIRRYVKSVWIAAQCSGDKLPKEFSTHPSWVTIGDLRVKVLSSKEAKQLQPKSRRPHRIFVLDVECQKWAYAGKYAQHCRMIHKKGTN